MARVVEHTTGARVRDDGADAALTAMGRAHVAAEAFLQRTARRAAAVGLTEVDLVAEAAAADDLCEQLREATRLAFDKDLALVAGEIWLDLGSQVRAARILHEVGLDQRAEQVLHAGVEGVLAGLAEVLTTWQAR